MRCEASPLGLRLYDCYQERSLTNLGDRFSASDYINSQK